MFRNLMPALALGALLALAGCAAQNQVVPGQASAAPAAASAGAVIPTPPPSPAPASASGVLAFGDTTTYEDGLAVQVSAPEQYQVGRYAAGHDQARGIKVTITVTNNGSEAFDPVTLMVNASHAGTPASQIFDSQNDLTGAPQTQVLPGKSISFDVGFSVGDEVGDLQLEVTPSFNHTDAVFVGEI